MTVEGHLAYLGQHAHKNDHKHQPISIKSNIKLASLTLML